MNLAKLVLIFWGALYLVLGLLQLPGDGDLYWQRWLGEFILHSHTLPSALGPETFTAASAPWVPQEWLFSLAVALTKDHHVFFLLSFLLSAIPLCVLFTIYARSRNVASSEAVGIVLLFSGVACLESFGVRAQVLGWLALAAFMFFLERRDRWYYAAFPTAILWANLHASVTIAPAIVFARLAGTFAGGGFRALGRSRDLVMLPAVLLALLCTPLGLRLPLYAATLAHSPIRHFIQEWQPVGLHDLSFMAGALPLALLIACAGRTMFRTQAILLFPSALLFAATLFAARNIALFAIVAAPLAARAIDALVPRIRALDARIRDLAPAALVAIGVAIVISAFALHYDQRTSPPVLPVAAVESLGRDRATHRLFCENFSWCSIALQYPSLRVFMDGRCDPYPVTVWKQYIATITVRRSWAQLLRGYQVDSIVAQRGSRLANALGKDAGWKPSFQDRAFVVYRYE